MFSASSTYVHNKNNKQQQSKQEKHKESRTIFEKSKTLLGHMIMGMHKFIKKEKRSMAAEREQ